MRKFGSVNNYFWINMNLTALVFYIMIFFPMFEVTVKTPAAFLVYEMFSVKD